MRSLVLLLCAAGCLAGPARLVQGPEGLSLTLIHVNDMHARYEETNKFSGACSVKDAAVSNCYGGHARVATVIKEARAEQPDNVLVLNAGDTYQGTVYYSIFKWNISATFVNMLNFDAITLGNHEFDDHTGGLVPYVERLEVPLVLANADFSKQPELDKLNIKKSVVVKRAGVQIGIIGYLTPDTVFLSSTDNVTFTDEIEALKTEAALLKKQGVEIIIGLGHSGYQKDQEIAKQVPDIDIVVGGHSHSFLYTGPQPDIDVPVGLYPTWITQDSGRKVPVVQAYAFTKYIGKLKLEFDHDGELVSLDGGPILLNKNVTKDPDTDAEVQKWKAALDKEVLKPIGKTTVLLDGASCRYQECNLGNLITDALVFGRAEFLRLAEGWTDSPIGLANGGSIRTSIDASTSDGVITIKDVMEVMPFDNLAVRVQIRGTVLMEALEHGVSEYVPGQAWKGSFLQMSGVRVVYDVSRPAGQRVLSAEVRCGNCTIPSYSALDNSTLYGVLISGFMANGGDGFTMFANNEESETLQDTDRGMVEHYIEKRGLVYPGEEGRVTFQTSASSSTPAGQETTTASSAPTSTSTLTPTPTPSSAVRAGAVLPLLLAALLAQCA